jgi:hypothetical protein
VRECADADVRTCGRACGRACVPNGLRVSVRASVSMCGCASVSPCVRTVVIVQTAEVWLRRAGTEGDSSNPAVRRRLLHWHLKAFLRCPGVRIGPATAEPKCNRQIPHVSSAFTTRPRAQEDCRERGHVQQHRGGWGMWPIAEWMLRGRGGWRHCVGGRRSVGGCVVVTFFSARFRLESLSCRNLLNLMRDSCSSRSLLFRISSRRLKMVSRLGRIAAASG